MTQNKARTSRARKTAPAKKAAPAPKAAPKPGDEIAPGIVVSAEPAPPKKRAAMDLGFGTGINNVYRRKQIEAVKAFAAEHRNLGNWMEVDEAWTDEQIHEAIGRARTDAGAIKKVGMVADDRAAYRDDIRSA